LRVNDLHRTAWTPLRPVACSQNMASLAAAFPQVIMQIYMFKIT